MESPRLIPAEKMDIPTDISDQTTTLVSEIPSVDSSKISQDPEINNAKAINHENSRIPPEASTDVQDLSETTKSDRKSTGEAEESQSQQAQQVKSEEDNGEGSKSSDNQAAENLPEIRESGEVPQEGHQSSESQENISHENIENKENYQAEPESQAAQVEIEEKVKVEEEEVQVVEKAEEHIQEAHIEKENIVEEKHEAPQSENVVVAEVDQRDSQVKEEENIVNTEVKNEDQSVAVESQLVAENEEEQVSDEPKVEIQEPAKEPEAPVEALKTEEIHEVKAEQVLENKVEDKPEEQNNNQAVNESEEIKPVEEVQPVIENKPEEQNNIEAAPQEEVVKTEETQVQVIQVEEVKPAETVVEQQKGVFDFPVEAKTEESNKPEVSNPAVAVEENKEETDNAPAPEETPKETRSPKLKANLRINTQQNNVVTRIINYCAQTGEPLPDASVAEPEKKEGSGELPTSSVSVNSEGSSEVKKHYDNNQSLTDLLRPINMEEPQASPVIKRNATSTACIGNPAEENKEEPKEAQQPASAMIQSTTKARLTMDDFQKITSLGRGSYGEVFLVKKIANNKLYALKSIDKNFMKKEKKEHQVYVEREVLMKLNHPNIIKLVSSFQDKTKLYFVLEYVSGGEFSDYLRVQGKLSKEQIIFFSAEIINILEYLHTFGIAHRDMKPENLLLTQEGHIKCIDFGTARFLATDKRTAELYDIKKGEDTLDAAASAHKKNHRSTFVGTAQYVSPEMLEGSDCGAPADIWALGCMIYLMAVGQFPFIDMNEYLIFQKIKAASVKYPEDMDPEIKDIIQKILVKEPSQRLGAGDKDSGNGYEALRAHPLFKNTDFSTLNEQKPPVIEIASPHKKKSHDLQPTGNSGIGMQNRKVNSEDLTKPSPAKTSQAFNFQTENQVKVILSGLVLKKCGWLFYKPRQLILNNKPRLVYYDPDSNQLKGEIPLAPTTKAELESKTKFIVNCPNKKFVFKEMEHSAEKWVEIINKTVEQLYAKKPDQ